MERDNIIRTREVRRLHVFSFLLGAWMILAPFVLRYDHIVATWNSIIAGLVVLAFSYLRLRNLGAGWTSWGLMGMGLWFVFSPFIFGYTHSTTYWNELLLGLALLLLMFSAVGHSVRHHSHLAH